MSLLFMIPDAGAASPIDAVITTQSGTVQGHSEANLLTFKGLPYAAPPIGEQRWRAPQPAVPWQGARLALERGLSCIQKPRVCWPCSPRHSRKACSTRASRRALTAFRATR